MREVVLGEEQQHLELGVETRFEPPVHLHEDRVPHDERRVRLVDAERTHLGVLVGAGSRSDPTELDASVETVECRSRGRRVDDQAADPRRSTRFVQDAVVERGDLVVDHALLTGTEHELVRLVRPRLEPQLEQREPGAVVAGERHRVDERDARDVHRARAEPALVADVRDQVSGVELAVETETLGDIGHGASSLRRLNQKKPRPANVRR